MFLRVAGVGLLFWVTWDSPDPGTDVPAHHQRVPTVTMPAPPSSDG